MSTVRASTARFLGKQKSPNTRDRYKKDIMTWKRFCAEHDLHPLDGGYFAAQMFSEWLEAKYSACSVQSRFSGVTRWFDQLLRDGIVKNHGFRNVTLPKCENAVKRGPLPSEDDVVALVQEASKRGPRWEWLVSILAYGGVECAEAMRIRALDVRTWEGRTLVRVTSRADHRREIPVDGRLEVLTLGLSGVFAPTSTLGPAVEMRQVRQQLSDMSFRAVGRRLTVPDLRRFAIFRQASRGVPMAVIAKWLGHRSDDQLRRLLHLENPIDEVTPADVIELILVEPDGGRFGSGRASDSQAGAVS